MKRRNNNRRNFRRREEPYKINEKITAREVRLVSEEGAELLSVRDAIARAQAADLDLVEISPNANPPVAKIIDYKKFLFEQKKRSKELKSKQTKVVVKEIRMGPNTEEHDFNFKLNHAKTFLKEGAKVKAYVFFKGRTIVFKDRGEILLLKFAQELEEYGSLEQMPKLEGKKMIMMINPKKK
ncbi:MAG: translation initiation factor IF-3 [Crocinitomix sp.]|nr:translation initiation factor IF-3 [Crocinitomix sp.]